MSGEGSGPEGEEKPELPDETIVQSGESQAGSRDLSIPAGIEQNPGAPVLAGYILTRPLGQGAFAEVWWAWQVRTRKPVALKVFRNRTAVNWLYLQREVERLIRLDKHPNIVSLLDADLTGDIPYYAMDLMEGGSLDKFLGSGARPSADDVARWTEEISDALAYVHAKGLIHCDLKPANVMLDEQGRVRVADFGQSRILTDSAGALGSLFYMAPEQAVVSGEQTSLHPDVRWDIYALGMTLYGVLTGRVPHEEQRERFDAAPSLKARLQTYREVVSSHPLDWGWAAAAADEDLAAIAAKCGAPEPGQRYETIAAVRADLQARSERRPVTPLAGRRGYRARRFFERNIALVALGAAAAVLLAFAVAQIAAAQKDVVRRLAFSYAMRGRQFSEKGDDASAAVYYAESNRLHPTNLARLAALAHLGELPMPKALMPHKWGIRVAAIGPDGRRVLAASWDRGTFLWDAGGPEPLRISLSSQTPADLAAFSPDGKWALTGGRDGVVRLWDPATGALRRALPGHPGGAALVQFSTDSSRLLVVSKERAVFLWDPARGALLGSWVSPESELTVARLSPDGARVAAGTAAGFLWVLAAPALSTQSAVALPGADAELAWSPDGGSLARISDSGKLWLVELGPWAPAVAASTVTAAPVPARAARADIMSRLPKKPVILEFDNTNIKDILALFSAQTGINIISDAGVSGNLSVHLQDVPLDEAFRTILAMTNLTTLQVGDNVLRVLTPQSLSKERLEAAGFAKVSAFNYLKAGEFMGAVTAVRGAERVTQAAFSPDGLSLAAAAADGAVRTLDPATGEPAGAAWRGASAATLLAFTPDGRMVVTAGEDGAVEFRDAATGLRIGASLKHAGAVRLARLSADGKTLLTAGADGAIRLWDLPPPQAPAGGEGRADAPEDGEPPALPAAPGAAGVCKDAGAAEFNIHALNLRAMGRDPDADYALLTDPCGGVYIFRKDRLYDNKNDTVAGISGAMKINQKTLTLQDQDKNVQVYRLGEVDE